MHSYPKTFASLLSRSATEVQDRFSWSDSLAKSVSLYFKLDRGTSSALEVEFFFKMASLSPSVRE